jgi:hypothetical protein
MTALESFSNSVASEEADRGCLRMLRGREWAIAASLAPDPAAASADECEVCMETWLAGRVRVTLRRTSNPVPRQASRNNAWRWQLVRAIKVDDKAS